MFLIFNNRHFLESTGLLERDGTDVDAERLEERFQDTGFEVRRYDDVTCARMTKLMHDGRDFINIAFCKIYCDLSNIQHRQTSFNNDTI